MNLLSCRRNFSDPVVFGPHVCKAQDGNLSYCYDAAVGSTILIHGYHTDEHGAQQSYETIARCMPDLRFCGYLWPGGVIAIDFPLAVIRAKDAGARLRDVLNGTVTAKPIDVQTHSLGARVALEALKYGAGIQIRHLILSAPAVDDDSLNVGGEFAGALDNCVSINVFYSRRDPVLAKDYPLGTLFREQALGLNGPKIPRARLRAFDCSAVVDSHSGYRSAPQYFQAWRSILEGTAAPGLTTL